MSDSDPKTESNRWDTERKLRAEITRLHTALATARNDALAEAVTLAENWTRTAHAAYDIRKGTFPKMSPVGEALADAIRSLITKPTIEGGKPKAEKDPDT